MTTYYLSEQCTRLCSDIRKLLANWDAIIFRFCTEIYIDVDNTDFEWTSTNRISERITTEIEENLLTELTYNWKKLHVYEDSYNNFVIDLELRF